MTDQPISRQVRCANERRVAAAERWGTIYPFPGWRKAADTALMADERAQTMRQSGNRWAIYDQGVQAGVRTWKIMGRWSWGVRREWLIAKIKGTWEPVPD